MPRGSTPIPRKIAGNEMITMDWFIVAISMPSVVFDSATHRCWNRPRYPLSTGPLRAAIQPPPACAVSNAKYI